MSFIINATIHDRKIHLIDNSTTPDNILSLFQSLKTSFDNKISLMHKASNLPNLTSAIEKEEVVQYVMKVFDSPFSVLHNPFPSGALSVYGIKINSTIPSPTIFNEEVHTVTSRSFTSINSVFNTSKVELECHDRLYIENNYFNTKTLIINNRTLTPQEICHISRNIMDKCPIKEMELRLSINHDNMPEESRVRKVIEGTGYNLRESLLKHTSRLEEDKAAIISLLETNKGDLEKCQVDFVPKIIDILCSEVVDFDFMSV